MLAYNHRQPFVVPDKYAVAYQTVVCFERLYLLLITATISVLVIEFSLEQDFQASSISKLVIGTCQLAATLALLGSKLRKTPAQLNEHSFVFTTNRRRGSIH